MITIAPQQVIHCIAEQFLLTDLAAAVFVGKKPPASLHCSNFSVFIDFRVKRANLEDLFSLLKGRAHPSCNKASGDFQRHALFQGTFIVD